MAYAPIPRKPAETSWRGTVASVDLRGNNPTLIVGITDQESGVILSVRCRMTTELFYAATVDRIDDFIGRAVEVTQVNGVYTIVRFLGGESGAPAEVRVGTGQAHIADDGITVAGASGQAVISPDSTRIEYGDIGFTAETGKATMQGGRSQLISVGEELIAGAAGQDLASQIHYQIMLSPLAPSPTISVYNAQNEVIGHIKRDDIAVLTDLLVVAESGLVGQNRNPGNLAAPAMPDLTATAGANRLEFRYSFTRTGSLYYDGFNKAGYSAGGAILGAGHQLDINRPRQTFVTRDTSPVILPNAPLPVGEQNSTATVITEGGLLVNAYTGRSDLLLNNGAAATTAGNSGVTVTTTGLVTCAVPAKWQVIDEGVARAVTAADLAGYVVGVYWVRAYDLQLHIHSTYSPFYGAVILQLNAGLTWQEA